jgi:hypothetical protein
VDGVQVEMSKCASPPRPLDFSYCFVGTFLIAVPSETEVKAGLGQGHCGGPSDAAVSSGNDRNRHLQGPGFRSGGEFYM